jgi:hypothetical protein
MIVPAGMQGVEVGVAADAEHHGLAVEHEVCLPDLARGLDEDSGRPSCSRRA